MLSVCLLCLLSAHAGFSNQLCHTQKQEKSKITMLFPKWNIDITIQFHILTMHVLCAIAYATTPLVKSTHLQVVPQQSTQNTASWAFQISKKSQRFFLSQVNRVLQKPRNNCSYLGSFAKVFASIIPGSIKALQEQRIGKFFIIFWWWQRVSKSCLPLL